MGFATCGQRADIGVFGGSGFYNFGDNVKEISIETPYGAPSDKVSLVEIAGKRVAFLPRHGRDHQYSPTYIPYRANLWAMKALGVKKIIGPCAAGSLQAEVKPGSFVICDQFVDRTKHRQDTFFQGPHVTHLSAADPYCPQLRKLALQCAQELNIETNPQGTMVVIEGPRFSTKAESQWFRQMGWTVVNMTGYPECYLAKELEICYVNISLITDYDAGLEGIAEAVVASDVIKVFQENNHKVRNLIYKMIEKIEIAEDCDCLHVVEKNRMM